MTSASGAEAEPDSGLGRETVAELVDGLIHEVAQGSGAAGRSLYLEGPPGVGKTHLLRRILSGLDSSIPVLEAVGVQSRRNEAFGLTAQLVGPAPADGHPAEHALDRVEELCQSGPAVIWVDDAHQADEATLTVLRRIVWSARVLPLAVIITARPDRVREGLRMLTDQVEVAYRLPPMDGPMVEQLAADVLGRRPGPRLRGALEEADGNPLFVVELLRGAYDAGLLVDRADGARDLATEPPSSLGGSGRLDRVIREHLAQLDEPARDLVATLAVNGGAIAVPVLAEVMFTAPQDLSGPIDRLTAAGLVRTTALGDLDFAHELHREIAYDDVPETNRRLIHRRIARVAEGRGAGAALVAEHLLRARETPADPAVRETVQALRQVAAEAERYAPEVAADLLELVDLTQEGPESEELLLRRAWNLSDAGHGAVAERLIQDRIGSVADRGVAAGLQEILIRQLANRGQVPGAVAVIDRTRSIPGLPEATGVGLAATRAWLRMLDGELLDDAEIDGLADSAAAVGGGAALTMTLVRASRALLAGRPSAALELLIRIDEPEWASVDTVGRILQPWALYLRDGPVSLRDAVRGIRGRPRDETRWVDPYLGSLVGGGAMMSGDWDDAVAELDTALELAEEVGSGWVSIAVGERAYLDAHRGDTAGAQARLEAFRRRRLPLQFGRDNPGVAELAALEAAGSSTEAATLVRSLWTTARAQPGRGPLEHAADILRVALSTGQRRLATQLAADVRGDLVDAESGRRGIEPTVLLRGMALLLQGMVDGDADRLEAAAELFARQGWHWLRLQAQEELAVASASDRPRAVTAAERALAGYDRIGARVDRDRLLARTRGLSAHRGMRSGRPRVERGWAALTATERDVVGLLREGLTNREIAARLYISRRTVETHVSHVLAKTGLRSRLEVATATEWVG